MSGEVDEAVGTNVVRFHLKRHKWLEDLAIQQAIRRDTRPIYLIARAYGVSGTLIERIRIEHTTPKPVRRSPPPMSKATQEQRAAQGRAAIKNRWDNTTPEQRSATAKAAALKRWARVRAARGGRQGGKPDSGESDGSSLNPAHCG